MRKPTMRTLTRGNVIHSMSREHEPAFEVVPGEQFRVETEDAYGGSVMEADDVYPKALRPNPATGPICIKGAPRGSILRVDIVQIAIAGPAVMCSPQTVIMPIQGTNLLLREGIAVPVSPMVGVIGTAPRTGSVPTTTPGEHGGNMDCRQVRTGASVFLPVSVEGALLALGDVHALMGDGEVGGCGAEVRAEVTLRTAVVSDKVPTPCVVTPEAVCFVASAQTLDECERMVLAKAHRFLAEQMGLHADEALRIMSLVGDLGVCQVVDPLKTMRFALPVAVLERLGTSVILPGRSAPRRP